MLLKESARAVLQVTSDGQSIELTIVEGEKKATIFLVKDQASVLAGELLRLEEEQYRPHTPDTQP